VPAAAPAALTAEAARLGLWDVDRLQQLGVLAGRKAICPLCRKPIRASELIDSLRHRRSSG
jgi:hypothetical protein